MTRQREREEFVALMTQEGVPLGVIRGLMRAGTTLHRLAEAACNGDWPADNGERKVEECPKCQGLWVPSTIKSNGCPDCRAEAVVSALCAPHGLTPIFNGDPRGAVLKVKVPSGRTNDGGREGICVP
jgi:hypothetical protein